MTLHRVASIDHLRTGSYGIREPEVERCPEVAEASIDAALVPGLAWDRRGSRLGRGAGYYDRLFGNAAWRGFRCGIFFSFQEMEPHVVANYVAKVAEKDVSYVVSLNSRKGKPKATDGGSGVVEQVTSERIVEMFAGHGYELLGTYGPPYLRSAGELVVLRSTRHRPRRRLPAWRSALKSASARTR